MIQTDPVQRMAYFHNQAPDYGNTEQSIGGEIKETNSLI